MVKIITREAAWELLRKYNKDPFHLQHALTVEGVMRWYAEQLGFASEVDFWGMVGLLHDIDFELYPEEHCIKARTDMGCCPDAPFEERSGHGTEVAQEEVQVKRFCRRLFS